MVMLVYQRVDVGCILIALGPIWSSSSKTCWEISTPKSRRSSCRKCSSAMPPLRKCGTLGCFGWRNGDFTSKNGDFTSENGDFTSKTGGSRSKHGDLTSRKVISPAKVMLQAAKKWISPIKMEGSSRGFDGDHEDASQPFLGGISWGCSHEIWQSEIFRLTDSGEIIPIINALVED